MCRKCYSNTGGNWTEVAPLNTGRTSFTMTTVGQFILVIGGDEDRTG